VMTQRLDLETAAGFLTEGRDFFHLSVVPA
jgi:hypothetical protein